MITSSCERCSANFEWEPAPKGNPRLYCDICRVVRQKEAKLAYAHSERGRAASRAATARWMASEKGSTYLTEYHSRPEIRLRDAEKQRRQRRKPGVAERQAAWSEKYRKTPKGRAIYIINTQNQRGIPTDNLRVLVEGIVAGECPCYSCGAAATEVDHVLPVSMAEFLGIRSEVDEYVAPICRPCHIPKSAQDIRDLRRMRRLLKQ